MSITVTAITDAFDAMLRAGPHRSDGGPGTSARRLATAPPTVVAHLEVDFPEKVRALRVAAPLPISPRPPDTAGLAFTFRHDGLRVAAEPDVDVEMFATLVADLLHHVKVSTHPAGRALLERLSSWRQMLAAGARSGLSPGAQLGLYGELLVLRDLLLPRYGPAAVDAWTGPLRDAQDFLLARSAVEVKSVTTRDGLSCRISSEAQLDTTNLDHLALVHQTMTVGDNGTTLAEIIDSLRRTPAIAADPALFERRLLCAGWLDLHRDRYQREAYELTGRRCYDVVEGFPRLSPRDLPRGLGRVSYQVDLSQCDRFLSSEKDLLRAAPTDPGAPR